MRLVVTGREGQVVRALMERGQLAGHTVVPLGRPSLDLSGDAEGIGRALAAAAPDAIVSAAAYTAVDRAETERDLAFAVNGEGAGAVAQGAGKLGVPLVHLSTDYVFDGSKSAPYNENDETAPQTVYGASKLAGEQQVLARHQDAAILRTAWVYSPFGANFVKTMLRLAGDGNEVRVVADQIGNPTSALDIADGVIKVAENLLADSSRALRGIFHMSGAGGVTWADFAERIFATSAVNGGPSAVVRPIKTEDYPTSARRPADSRLDCGLLHDTHHVRLPDWRDALGATIKQLI